jgi:alpha-beta hydrolase superfamily lysophospholipase
LEAATSFNITCADGHKMPLYAWLPNAEPTAIIHIAHGLAEYAMRYQPIAQLLTQQGFAVYAHDQRGHGNAVLAIAKQGIVSANWFNNQVADIELAIQHIKKLHPQKKVFLIGHSMGSFVVQRYVQTFGNTINGAVLSATNGQQDPLMPFGIAIAWLQATIMGSKYRSKLINKLSFGKFNTAFAPNRTAYDWLSRNEKEVDKYIADSQCGFISSARYYYDFFRGIKAAFDAKNIAQIPHNLPIYAFAGDKDPVGLFGKGFIKLIENWQAAGVKKISYKLYRNGRHEMLNEVNRGEVVADLTTWIKKQL